MSVTWAIWAIFKKCLGDFSDHIEADSILQFILPSPGKSPASPSKVIKKFQIEFQDLAEDGHRREEDRRPRTPGGRRRFRRISR